MDARSGNKRQGADLTGKGRLRLLGLTGDGRFDLCVIGATAMAARIGYILISLVCLQNLEFTEAQELKEGGKAASERTGEVLIDSVRIVRTRDIDGPPDKDAAQMKITLWFASSSLGESQGYLLSLTEFAAVIDDSGKLLTSKDRLERIPGLVKEARLQNYYFSKGQGGPIVEVVMDAPARSATAIKALKGKAVIIRPVCEIVEHVVGGNGTSSIDHPKLTKFKIQARIERQEHTSTVTISLPSEHARHLGPWEIGQFSGQRELSKRETSRNGLFEQRITVRGRLPKTCTLRLALGHSCVANTFEFNFKMVQLPE